MISFEIESLAQLPQAAEWLIKHLEDKKVVAFYGEMGTGKTTLIKEICFQMGSVSNITSPTFAIVNEYTLYNDSVICHFDFYRIIKQQELIDIGFEEYITSGNYCFIEWPEMGESLLPQETMKINIKVGEKQKRILTIFV
jgi:tRNA threonylcarbamoyladenosine biosynthesis protein TsaE